MYDQSQRPATPQPNPGTSIANKPTVFAADTETHHLDDADTYDHDEAGAHEPLLNGRPTASMELSEIERELALAHGSGAAGDGHGGGEGAKGTLMEGIANVRFSPLCPLCTCVPSLARPAAHIEDTVRERLVLMCRWQTV